MQSVLPFGSTDDPFDDPGSYVPAHLPEPGPFLDAGRLLEGDDHVTVHGWSRDVFEARGVSDPTFGYNLARLNLDARHPDAGLRYALDGDDLRAEFVPTTAFCPQAETLAVAASRAWNDRGDGAATPVPPSSLGVDRVRVRVAPVHREHERINDRLRGLERADG